MEVDTSEEGFYLLKIQTSGRGRVLPHPKWVGGKENPDRTVIVETRLISDLGAVNSGFAEDDLFPVWAPAIVDIVAAIQRGRRFPKK